MCGEFFFLYKIGTIYATRADHRYALLLVTNHINNDCAVVKFAVSSPAVDAWNFGREIG